MDELEEIRKRKLEELKREMMKPKELIIEANDADFQEKIIKRSGEIPIVVDFWAQWCTPCLMISPILEKLVEEYAGKFILAKVNVDYARVVAQTYGIMSIPSVKMFKNGEIADEFLGAIPEPMARQWMERNLR